MANLSKGSERLFLVSEVYGKECQERAQQGWTVVTLA